jgi:hypothetical protein
VIPTTTTTVDDDEGRKDSRSDMGVKRGLLFVVFDTLSRDGE